MLVLWSFSTARIMVAKLVIATGYSKKVTSRIFKSFEGSHYPNVYSQLRQRRWESQLQKYLPSSSDLPAMQLTENSVGRSERFGATFNFSFFFCGVGIGGWSFPESSPFLLDRTFQHFLIVQVQQPRGRDSSKYEDRLFLDYLLCESSSQHGHTHQWGVQETGWIPLKN